MSACVESCNVGSARTISGGKDIPTGIEKLSVGSLEVRDPGPKHGGQGSGVVGDFLGDRAHHGGNEQALYAFSRAELDWWATELGRQMPSGHFGENLTVDGDVDAALLDEVWQVGTATLRVSGPRIPCQTFAAHIGVDHWVKRFTQRGRTGAYLAVVEPGVIHPGDEVHVISTPEHGIDVPTSFRAWMGDKAAVATIIQRGAGSDEFRAELRP